jgi:hypothetical protein
VSETGLVTTFTDIQDAMSQYMGYDPDYTNDDTDQKDQIDGFIKRGLIQAYYPPAITGRMHQWSWLRPTAEISLCPSGSATVSASGTDITTASAFFYPSMVGKALEAESGTSYTIDTVTSTTAATVTEAADDDDGTTWTFTADGDYRLPDDYAQLEGAFRFSTGSGYCPPTLVGEGYIRHRRSESQSTGTPLLVAVRPQATTNASGQRFELCVYPTPDALYAVSYRYSVLPSMLVNTTNEYPYGGAMHGEMILESCLAIAEQMTTEGQGIHKALFLERLKTSIDADLQASTPDRFGRPGSSGAYSPRRGTLAAQYDDSPP